MNRESFNEKNVLFDVESTTQDEVFRKIASLAFKQGYTTNEEKYYNSLIDRENEVTTGFKDGFAIPHGKDDTVIKPGVFLFKFTNDIEWNALDGKPVKVAIALAIPEQGAEEHLKVLSSIARKLIDDDFRNNLLEETDIANLTNIIEEIEM